MVYFAFFLLQEGNVVFLVHKSRFWKNGVSRKRIKHELAGRCLGHDCMFCSVLDCILAVLSL